MENNKCEKCDRMIDLDYDEHWEHFKDKYAESYEEYLERSKEEAKKVEAMNGVYVKQMKGGKNGK